MNYKTQHVAYNLAETLKAVGFVNPVYVPDSNGEAGVQFDGGTGLAVTTPGAGGGSVRILDQRGGTTGGWTDIATINQRVFTTGVVQFLVEGSNPLETGTATTIAASNVTTSAANRTITVAGASFTASDLGKLITVAGLAADNGTYRIVSITSGTVVVVTKLDGTDPAFSGTGPTSVAVSLGGSAVAAPAQALITVGTVANNDTVVFRIGLAAGNILATLTAAAGPTLTENQFLSGAAATSGPSLMAQINAHSVLKKFVVASMSGNNVLVKALAAGLIGNGIAITGTTTNLLISSPTVFTPVATITYLAGGTGAVSTAAMRDDPYNRIVGMALRAGLKFELWLVPPGTAPTMANFGSATLADELWPNDYFKLSSLV